MTMNVHLLQHLPSCVRQFGPLWSFSCFAFENLNGFLSGCIHGKSLHSTAGLFYNNSKIYEPFTKLIA